MLPVNSYTDDAAVTNESSSMSSLSMPSWLSWSDAVRKLRLSSGLVEQIKEEV